MRASSLGRLHDFFVTHIHVEAGNVLRNSAFKQLDVLGHIANMTAQLLWVPLVQRRTVKTGAPTKGRPHTRKRACKRGLATATWSDDEQALARLEINIDARNEGALTAGNTNRQILRRKANMGHGQLRFGLLLCGHIQQLIQTME